uniref:hypothetical protein n=1 Tax=Cephaleuros parasiticus TaxID=173370 RepID=UPI001EDE70F7|nr:hypothetical protein MFQ79_pgp048 [Cephaleuros parasiticus]UIB39014.1 hypothetical protein [Cephaleuros parasiticus]
MAQNARPLCYITEDGEHLEFSSISDAANYFFITDRKLIQEAADDSNNPYWAWIEESEIKENKNKARPVIIKYEEDGIDIVYIFSSQREAIEHSESRGGLKAKAL